jgi:hypothetical protein
VGAHRIHGESGGRALRSPPRFHLFMAGRKLDTQGGPAELSGSIRPIRSGLQAVATARERCAAYLVVTDVARLPPELLDRFTGARMP